MHDTRFKNVANDLGDPISSAFPLRRNGSNPISSVIPRTSSICFGTFFDVRSVGYGDLRG